MQTDLHFSFFYTHLRICFHLFLEREEGKEERREGKERERNINVREKRRLVASHTHSDCRLDVPGPGIEPSTFRLQGDAPTNRATLARATLLIFKCDQYLILWI